MNIQETDIKLLMEYYCATNYTIIDEVKKKSKETRIVDLPNSRGHQMSPSLAKLKDIIVPVLIPRNIEATGFLEIVNNAVISKLDRDIIQTIVTGSYVKCSSSIDNENKPITEETLNLFSPGDSIYCDEESYKEIIELKYRFNKDSVYIIPGNKKMLMSNMKYESPVDLNDRFDEYGRDYKHPVHKPELVIDTTWFFHNESTEEYAPGYFEFFDDSDYIKLYVVVDLVYNGGHVPSLTCDLSVNNIGTKA